MTVKERAAGYVRELRMVVSFGKDSMLAQMIWGQIERAYVLGYQQGIEDSEKLCERRGCCRG